MNNVEKLINEYLKYLRNKNYAENTIKVMRNILNQLSSFLEEKKIPCINSMEKPIAREFALYLKTICQRCPRVKKKEVSANYLRGKLLKFKSFFQYLLERNKILFNPLEKIEMPLPELRLPRNVLTENETRKLLEIPNLSTDIGKRDRAMLEIAYSSALRRKEISNLKINDIDFSKEFVFVRQGKPKKDRVVPVGKSALKSVRIYLDNARPYLILDSKIKNLFLTQYGNPMSADLLSYVLREYVKKIGFKKRVTWHTIRHTCATHLLQNGADIRYIKEILGHVSVQTTQIYTKVYPADLIKEVRKYHPTQKKKRKKID